MEQPAEHDRGQPVPLYAAFLIRCRRSGKQWHYLLENVATRERRGFESLTTLVLYLQASLKEIDETLDEMESAARNEGRPSTR